MARYFKLVATNPKADWMFAEYLAGRSRFGWSGPGSNLRRICDIALETRSEEERTTWRFTRFLLERIVPGDRLVIQHRQPLREFLVAEVTGAYESSDPACPDFNHILPVRPLTPQYVPINAVPQALKHDLSKRGQYYQIYPESSIAALDELVADRPWERSDWGTHRREKDELDATLAAVRAAAVRQISAHWPAKAFEAFCARLCEHVPFIEVNEQKDRFKGWDLLIRIVDPLTNTAIPGFDNVPVQCKNFSGEVRTLDPITDLRRCLAELKETGAAYLFIMGELHPEFHLAVRAAEEELQVEFGRPLALHVIDQDRIAELYLRYMVEDRQVVAAE